MTLRFKKCAEFTHYASLSAFVDYCDNIKRRDGVGNDAVEQPRSFNHTDNYEQASELAVHGWPQGVKKMESNMAQLREGMDYMPATQSELDIVGPICIVGEYLGGNPECMLQPNVELDIPVVNICVDVSGSCAIDESAWRYRGAALLNLAQDLENSGHRVCIYIVSAIMSFKTGKWNGLVVRVKAPDEEFNIHGLAYSLAHPSMFRRHVLRNLEGTPLKYAQETTNRAYGRPVEFLDIDGLGSTMGDIDLHIPSMNECAGFCPNVKSAGKYVYGLAKEQGLIE